MTPYFSDASVTIYHGDAREILPQLGAADHLITDPPYSEHVHTKSRAGARALKGGPTSENSPANFSRKKEFGFESLTDELRECISEYNAAWVARWALVFSDVESTHLWRESLVRREIEYVRTGAWIKIGATPQFTGDRPGVGMEAITICHREGRKRWNGGGTHAVWPVPIVLNRGGEEVRIHETQKPLRLLSRLVELFTDPGELIVDPCMGSGTTLRAAKDLGRRAIGIELRESDCENAAKRMGQEVLNLGAA